MFPGGRLPSRRWAPVALVGAGAVLLVAVVAALSPGPVAGLEGVPNPLGVAPPADARRALSGPVALVLRPCPWPVFAASQPGGGPRTARQAGLAT